MKIRHLIPAILLCFGIGFSVFLTPTMAQDKPEELPKKLPKREPENIAKFKIDNLLEATLGEASTWEIKKSDPATKITLSGAPEGMRVEGGKLLWTPKEEDVGFFEFTITGANKKALFKKDLRIVVGRPSLDLSSFNATNVFSRDLRFSAFTKRRGTVESSSEAFPAGFKLRSNSMKIYQVFDFSKGEKHGKEIFELEADKAYAVAISESYLITFAKNHSLINVYRLKDGAKIKRLRFSSPPQRFQFLTENRLLISGYRPQILDCQSLHFMPIDERVDRLMGVSRVFRFEHVVPLSANSVGFGPLILDPQILQVRALLSTRERESSSHFYHPVGSGTYSSDQKNFTSLHRQYRKLGTLTHRYPGWAASELFMASQPIRVRMLVGHRSQEKFLEESFVLEYRHAVSGELLGYQNFDARRLSSEPPRRGRVVGPASASSFSFLECEGKIVLRRNDNYTSITPPDFGELEMPLRFKLDEGLLSLGLEAEEETTMKIRLEGNLKGLKVVHSGMPRGATIDEEGNLKLDPPLLRETLSKGIARFWASERREWANEKGESLSVKGIVAKYGTIHRRQVKPYVGEVPDSVLRIPINVTLEARNDDIELTKRMLAFFVTVSTADIEKHMRPLIRDDEKGNKLAALEKRIAKLEAKLKELSKD